MENNSVYSNLRGWICKLQICVRVNCQLYEVQMLKFDWTIFSQSDSDSGRHPENFDILHDHI